MTMLKDFHDLIHQEVIVHQKVGQNQYGEAEYNPDGLIIIGRIEQRNKTFLSKDGVVNISTCAIYCPPTPKVTHEDKITLPDGTTPPLIQVDQIPDENGAIYYQALWVGKTGSN